MAPLLSLIATVMLIGGALFKLARDVRQHDRRIGNRDDDLVTWINDDNADFLLERVRIAGQRNRSEITDYHGYMLRERMRGELRHRFRDQHREAERLVEDTIDAEHWPHRLYRQLARRPLPQLTAPDQCAGVIATWQHKYPKADAA